MAPQWTLALLSGASHAPSAMPSETKPRESSHPATTKTLDEEARLNAPDNATVFMLAAISLATLLMWGAGRAACNYRVKGESLQPRAVLMSERTTSAKGTAFEWAQAFHAGRMEVLNELSSPELQGSLRALQASCSSCESQAPQSVATVLSESDTQAEVTVETWVSGVAQKSIISLGKSEGAPWAVTAVQASR